MQVRQLAVITALTLAPFGVLIPAGHAAVPTCKGLEATVIGTEADDTLFGTEGPDIAVLGDGDDFFSGRGGDDVVCGGAGEDEVLPGAGDDIVLGEAGYDIVREGDGNDELDGGTGIDRLFYSASGATGLRLDARIGKATSSTGTDRFRGFESYVGTRYGDVLIGSALDERFDTFGNEGSQDTVYGLGGDDTILSTARKNTAYVVDAGDGDDLVRAYGTTATVKLGAGNDHLHYYYTRSAGNRFDGGPGIDAISLVNNPSGYSVNLNQWYLFDRALPSRRMVIGHFENVKGSYGPDRIVGSSAANYLNGGEGSDEIHGLSGADRINGGLDAADNDFDSAYGGPGADICQDIEFPSSC